MALVDDGEIPAAAKLKQQVPRALVEVTRVPGVGAKTARRDLRRARDRDARASFGDAAEQGGCATSRASAPRPSRTCWRRGADRHRGAGRAAAALRRAPDRRRDRRGAPRQPGVRARSRWPARRGGWTETCKDIDLIATATIRAALAKVLAEHPLAADVGAGGDAGARIVTHNGLKVELRVVGAARSSATCSSTSPARRSTTWSCASARSRAGQSVSEHGIKDDDSGEVTTVRDRAAGVRGARPRLHRAGAARGRRRDQRRPRPASCPSW